MAEKILISRWTKRTLDFLGTEVPIELRALSKREAPEFMRFMYSIFEGVGAAASEEDSAKGALSMMDKVCSDYIEGVFERCVRPAAGAELEIDGQAITTGAGLIDVAPFTFVMAVLGEMQKLLSLSGDQGNASGSPSESVPVAVPSGSGTDAEPIAPESNTSA